MKMEICRLERQLAKAKDLFAQFYQVLGTHDANKNALDAALSASDGNFDFELCPYMAEVDVDDLQEQLAKANERIEILLPITDTLYGLARNQLWIAYVWNDHNFKETPERYAKEAAESLSILNVEEANKLFDAYQQLRKEQE